MSCLPRRNRSSRVLPNIRPAYDIQELAGTSHLPRSIYCPITYMPMMDPVVAADGHSYERNAIKTWFEKAKTSPVTRESLPNTSLLPNHALRGTISELVQAPGQDTA